MSSAITFLGVEHDLSDAVSVGVAKFKVMDSTFDKGEMLIAAAIKSGFLGPGGAAKVRGVYGGCARELWGNVGKAAVARALPVSMWTSLHS